jgi:hypothetical protein
VTVNVTLILKYLDSDNPSSLIYGRIGYDCSKSFIVQALGLSRSMFNPPFQVDGLTKVDEEGYTYEHYYGNKHYQQYGSDYK